MRNRRVAPLLAALIFALFAILPLAGQDRTATELSDVDSLEAAFLDAFVASDYQEAFGSLEGNVAFSDAQLRDLRESTEGQMSSVRPQYGAAFGWERIISEELGDRLIQRIYLVHQEQIPLRVRFVWYRNQTQWRLIALNWDDSTPELLSW